MRVMSLTLRRFRNYRQVSVACHPRLNLIVGNNGQGKTNLLEALYYLSHARSHRTNRDIELVNQSPLSPEEDPTTQARTTLIQEGVFTGEHTVEARLIKAPAPHTSTYKTQFRVDGQPVRNRSEVLGKLVTVAFTSADLLLFRGAPSDRRHWLDGAIVQIQPLHFQALAQCQRLIKQKKLTLLGPSPDSVLLGVLNEQLAEAAAQVTWSRIQLLMTLIPLAAQIMDHLSQHQSEGQLDWLYHIHGMSQEVPRHVTDWSSLDEPALHALYRQRLTTILPQEIRQQQCLFGPQREDFTVAYDTLGLAAHRYASQGQQRSLVLALKLAEVAYLSEQLQEPPVLLLDDVMAELDPTRQALLIESLGQRAQVFLTTTHLDPALHGTLLEQGIEYGAAQASLWRVKAGEVTHSPFAGHLIRPEEAIG